MRKIAVVLENIVLYQAWFTYTCSIVGGLLSFIAVQPNNSQNIVCINSCSIAGYSGNV